MKYTHTQVFSEKNYKAGKGDEEGWHEEGAGVECLRKALLMARCISKSIKKVKLQILGIYKE